VLHHVAVRTERVATQFTGGNLHQCVIGQNSDTFASSRILAVRDSGAAMFVFNKSPVKNMILSRVERTVINILQKIVLMAVDYIRLTKEVNHC
jgi:hypothetical protein